MAHRFITASFILTVLTGAAIAQSSSLVAPVSPTDLTNYPTKSELSATFSAVQSQIPQPSMNVPPTEMTGGTIGTAGTYRPADARTPRITRSRTVTLAADGTATFDWTAQGAINTPVQVALTPVHSGTGVPKCWATAVSATSASVKCVVENVTLLTIVGIGVGSVTNSAPSGLSVGVIALPPS